MLINNYQTLNQNYSFGIIWNYLEFFGIFGCNFAPSFHPEKWAKAPKI